MVVRTSRPLLHYYWPVSVVNLWMWYYFILSLFCSRCEHIRTESVLEEYNQICEARRGSWILDRRKSCYQRIRLALDWWYGFLYPCIGHYCLSLGFCVACLQQLYTLCWVLMNIYLRTWHAAIVSQHRAINRRPSVVLLLHSSLCDDWWDMMSMSNCSCSETLPLVWKTL